MNLLSKLSSLLKDNSQDNTWSSTRFALLFTVLVSNLCIFSVWVFICIIKKEIVNIPTDIISLYSLANGITISGKIIQTRHELKYNQNKQISKEPEEQSEPQTTSLENTSEEKA